MNEDRAEALARDWLEAWNAHDLDAIMAHYHEGVAFTSPFVAELAGREDGTLHGAEELRAYFARALEAFPDLEFTGMRAHAGATSVCLTYLALRERCDQAPRAEAEGERDRRERQVPDPPLEPLRCRGRVAHLPGILGAAHGRDLRPKCGSRCAELLGAQR